jgi:hypothetical protein
MKTLLCAASATILVGCAFAACDARTSADASGEGGAADGASADARIDCPVAQPRLNTPCDWPAGAACQYHDQCPPKCGFPGADLVRCVNGQFEYQVCGYILGCPSASGT